MIVYTLSVERDVQTVTRWLDRLAVVYVTRDSLDGVLDDECDIWIKPPSPMGKSGDTVWLSEHFALRDELLGHLHVEDVRSWLGVVPETDRECIVTRNPRSC